MVRRRFPQRSVFELLLPDGGKLWDQRFLRIDEILSDEDLVELAAQALGRRRPRSNTRGRCSTPAEVVLRMLVLKHVFDWSFEECEGEVRVSLFYRAFCRIDCEKVPDAKTLIRLAQAIGPEARKRGLVRGRRMRVDTTVVETDVDYPTDSTLLSDGVRVITRTVNRLAGLVKQSSLVIRDRTGSMTRRLFQIVRASRQILKKEQSQVRMKKLYGETIAIAGAVIRDAERVVERLPRLLSASGKTDYTVCQNRVPDGDLWVASLQRHKQLFGRAPDMATADAAFSSNTNQQAAKDIGVRRVALPRRGRTPPKKEDRRWLRRALRWRTGSQGRISALKRRHGLRRCRYHGIQGINRWLGPGVIANNLLGDGGNVKGPRASRKIEKRRKN